MDLLKGVAFLKMKYKPILYLMKKRIYNNKPTYINIFNALQNLKQFCLDQSIKTLELPKICSELEIKKNYDTITIINI